MPCLVTLGDAVHWGIGLRREHKISTLVAQALRQRTPDLAEYTFAHAGALIGVGASINRPGSNAEVPVNPPTMLEQLTRCDDDLRKASVVLVNGGLHDVDVHNILNPFVAADELRSLTLEHCHDSMRVLLKTLVVRFAHPATQIVVTGYYPLLSPRSKPSHIQRVLLAHGLNPSPPAPLGSPSFLTLVVDRCLLFWKESTDCLRRAVADVNGSLKTPRLHFVDPGFNEDNAAFADDPWLWGLNGDLTPQDEAVEARRVATDAAIPWFDGLAREHCYRASVGFPNARGAGMYAEAITAAISG